MHVLIVDTLNSEHALNACAVYLQPVPTVTAHEDPDKWKILKMIVVVLNYDNIRMTRGETKLMVPPVKSQDKVLGSYILGCGGVSVRVDGREVIICPYARNSKDQLSTIIISETGTGTHVCVRKEWTIEKSRKMSTKTASVLDLAWLAVYRMLFTYSRYSMSFRLWHVVR